MQGKSIVIVALVFASALGAQTSPGSVSALRIGAQIGAGTIATPLVYIGGGIATRRVARAFGADEENARRAAYVGAYSSVWIATAAIPAAIGDRGRFPAALAGSALGMAAAVGAVRLGNHLYDDGRRSCGLFCRTLGAAVAVLPALGATVAYNASRR